MATENILVPFCRHSPDLKSLYHSFALAERVNAKIFVLFFKDARTDPTTAVETACIKIVNSACEDGLAVSYHIAGPRLERELPGFIQAEHIHVVIIGSGDSRMESVIRQMQPTLSVRVIKVEGKPNHTPKE